MHRRAHHDPTETRTGIRTRTGAALGALTLVAAAAAWTMTATTEPGAELVSADGDGAVYDVGTAFLTGGAETATSSAATSPAGSDLADTDAAGHTGDSYTTLGADARVVVPVASASADEQTLTLTYAAEADSAPELLVNGRSLGSVELPATDGWAEADTGVSVPAGLGSVELRGDGAAAIDLDRIALWAGVPLDEPGATGHYSTY